MPGYIVHVPQFSPKGTKGQVGSSNLLHRRGSGTENTSICTKITFGINTGSVYHRLLKAPSEINPMTMREGLKDSMHQRHHYIIHNYWPLKEEN